MSDAPDILVAGATGTTGRHTTTALAARGIRYRALTRRPDRITDPAAVAVRADLDDDDALRAALDGVRAAYLVTPSSEHAEAQQLRFIDLAAAAGVGHLVLLSQFAARPDSPVRFLRYHAVVEAHLAASGIGATVLRPNLFMQGILAFADLIRTQGMFAAPIGAAAVSLIDARDIGEVAAAALTADRPLGVLTLTGPSAITHAQIADALGRRTGQDVRFVDTDPQQFTAMLSGVLPGWQVDGLVEDYAHYASGEASAVTSTVPDILGRPARDIEAFARDYASSFTAKGSSR